MRRFVRSPGPAYADEISTPVCGRVLRTCPMHDGAPASIHPFTPLCSSHQSTRDIPVPDAHVHIRHVPIAMCVVVWNMPQDHLSQHIQHDRHAKHGRCACACACQVVCGDEMHMPCHVAARSSPAPIGANAADRDAYDVHVAAGSSCAEMKHGRRTRARARARRSGCTARICMTQETN